MKLGCWFFVLMGLIYCGAAWKFWSIPKPALSSNGLDAIEAVAGLLFGIGSFAIVLGLVGLIGRR